MQFRTTEKKKATTTRLSALTKIELNGTSVENLPFALCGNAVSDIPENVTIVLGVDVPCARQISWRATEPGIRNIARDIKAGCILAVQSTLASLDVADNAISEPEDIASIDEAFPHLLYVNISGNGLQKLSASSNGNALPFQSVMKNNAVSAGECPLHGIEHNAILALTLTASFGSETRIPTET